MWHDLQNPFVHAAHEYILVDIDLLVVSCLYGLHCPFAPYRMLADLP